MKKILLFIAPVLLFHLVVMGQKLPKPQPASPIQMRPYETFQLKNGLKVIVLEDHKLPKVSVNLNLSVDPFLEGDKKGFVNLAGILMMSGTKTKTFAQIESIMNKNGSRLTSNAVEIGGSMLSKGTEEILALIADIVMNPIYPDQYFNSDKKRMGAIAKSSKDNPQSLLNNLGKKIFYGFHSPKGELTTEKTVENITKDDLIKYHQVYFKPNIACLTISGDITLKEAKKYVKTYFSDWQQGEVSNFKDPFLQNTHVPNANPKYIISLINRNASVQSSIALGHPIPEKIAFDDIVPLTLMNTILGGSESSKLNQSIREKKGYTYSVRSSFSIKKNDAKFKINMDVRNVVTDSALLLVLEELKNMRQGNISDEEISTAKNTLTGLFSRGMEKPETLLSFLIKTETEGYPKDFFSTYIQKVENTKKEDLLRLAKKYLSRDTIFINIVGNAREISSALSQIASIQYYNTSYEKIDPPSEKPLPAGITAKSILLGHIKAVGGLEKIKNVNSLKIIHKISLQGATFTTETSMKKNKRNFVLKAPNNTLIQREVMSEGKGKRLDPQTRKYSDMTEQEIKDFLLESNVCTELKILEDSIDIKFIGETSIDSLECYELSVTYPSTMKSLRYYEKKTGLLKKTLFLNNPVLYSKYKNFDGIKFAADITQTIPQNREIHLIIDTVEINKEIDEEVFNMEE